jgi:hypothetical protein
MEECSDSASEVSVSRSLLKELVELRALRADKELLQKTNQFYVTQLSQLEVKISELKAIAQAREAEIHSLRDRLYQQDSERDIKGFTEARTLGELEAKVALLEEENLQFQDYSNLRMENERLHLELTHSNQVKQAYEEKYREAKVELLGLQTQETSNEVSREGFETQKKHADEWQDARLRHAKELEKERDKTAKLEMQLREKEAGERKLGKELSDAQLKSAGLQGQLAQLLEENRRLSEMISQQWRVSSGTISPIPSEPAQGSSAARSYPTAIKETVKTSPSQAANRPIRDLRPPLIPTLVKSQSSTSSPHSSIRGTPQPAVYVPSFMRNKKAFFPSSMAKSGSTHEVKPRQVQLSLDDSDDDFDLSIPEEVHLYI